MRQLIGFGGLPEGVASSGVASATLHSHCGSSLSAWLVSFVAAADCLAGRILRHGWRGHLVGRDRLGHLAGRGHHDRRAWHECDGLGHLAGRGRLARHGHDVHLPSRRAQRWNNPSKTQRGEPSGGKDSDEERVEKRENPESDKVRVDEVRAEVCATGHQ